MFHFITTLFSSLKSELISGLFTHTSISPTFILFLTIILGWWSCVSTTMTFLSIEAMIITNILWKLEKYDRVVSLIVRFIFSRIVAWWLFYTIYSQWYTEELTLFTSLSFFGFPFLLSWYIFDPFLLSYRRYTLGDRFDYFLSRFSFFTGYGLVPLILLLVWMFTEYYYCIYVVLCVMCSHQTKITCPDYARYLPYTKNQFVVDPLDWIESMIDRHT
jgi:hypothetical protein